MKGKKKGGKDASTAKTSQARTGTEDVNQEFSFWLCDGRIIRNIKQLAEATKTMSQETYAYHADQRKNDFADWTRDIIKNENLAYSIRKAKNKKEMEQILRDFLTIGEKPAEKQTKPNIKPKPKQQKPQKQKTTEAKANPKEIKKAQKEIEKKTDFKTLKTKEEQLLKEEAMLEEEDAKLNQAKIELTKKRYELLKRRGELEKKLFEHYMSDRTVTINRTEAIEAKQTKQTEPQTPIPIDFGKERISSLINEAKQRIGEENIEEAAKKYLEAENMLNRVPISHEEKRSLKFSIMELEADIKLAELKKAKNITISEH